MEEAVTERRECVLSATKLHLKTVEVVGLVLGAFYHHF